MRRWLIICLVVFASAFAAMAQTAPKPPADDTAVRDALVSLTKDWINAEDKRDGAALDRLLADDFVGIAPSGDKVTKKMVVPDPKGQGGGLSFTGDDFVAHVYGDMGVVTGNGTWKAKDKGTLCFTLAFVKHGEHWQIVTAHLSQVPQR